mgnify:CR=1 FL=1
MNVISYIQNLLNRNKPKQNEYAASGNYEDVFEKIDAIDNEYKRKKPTIPESGTYERMDYVAPTDEEIAASAEATLGDYKRSGEQSVENEIAALLEKYATDKNNNAKSYEKTLRSLSAAYEAAIEEARYDALKRGLARSSVAANTTAALAGEKAAKTAEAVADYESAQADVDAKISELGVKRQKAMDDFNIAYTAKLTEEINKLKSEREKLKAEALRYNNSLTEKENKEKIDKAKAESDLYTEELAQRAAEAKLPENAEEKDRKYQSIYTVLRDKLLTMTAAEAKIEIVKNPIYSQYLSGPYYYKLYDEFGR